jgi:hypothetical protein
MGPVTIQYEWPPPPKCTPFDQGTLKFVQESGQQVADDSSCPHAATVLLSNPWVGLGKMLQLRGMRCCVVMQHAPRNSSEARNLILIFWSQQTLKVRTRLGFFRHRHNHARR